MCRRICIEGMIKWLMFCISSPLIWQPNLGVQTSILAYESLWIRNWFTTGENEKNIKHTFFVNAGTQKR